MKISEKFSNERDPEEVPTDWHLERFRNWRNVELAQTDWTQLPDAPCDKDAYADYRQLLRDLPSVNNFSNADLPNRP